MPLRSAPLPGCGAVDGSYGPNSDFPMVSHGVSAVSGDLGERHSEPGPCRVSVRSPGLPRRVCPASPPGRAVGTESHTHGPTYAYDRVKQALMLESDRPIALRQAIRACRNGGTISVIGVYGGFIDKFPMGAVMNRSLTIRTGQCHVQRYLRPLLERIVAGEIDPSFVVTHRLPLSEAPRGFEMFLAKADNCEKVVLQA